MFINEAIQKKWAPVLDHEGSPEFKDSHRRAVTAQLLENTEIAMQQEAAFAPTSLLETSDVAPVNTTGNSLNYDPVLISLIRRAMPNLVAYDFCGVQPMTGPTGLIFALRPQYASNTGSNNTFGSTNDPTGANTAFYYEANTGASTIQVANSIGGNSGLGNASLDFGGNYTPGVVATGNNVVSGNAQQYNFASGMATSVAEQLGSTTGGNDFGQMAITIDRISVTAKSRALQAEYTIELAQDLKAIHGLDAETELATILQAEIMADINREIIRTVVLTGVQGAAETTTAGTFDLDIDSNGRWSVEKFKGLMFQIERDSNRIAKDTRRGKGNFMICSSDVASALQMAGVLDYTPALNSNNLQVDDTGNTFAGVLNGRTRVYIDPYAAGNYALVGYKGSSAFDAGLFYCPYVPLQMVRAVGQDTFQPKIGFKTRYGVVANPFAQGATQSQQGALIQNSNVFYRRILINNLL